MRIFIPSFDHCPSNLAMLPDAKPSKPRGQSFGFGVGICNIDPGVGHCLQNFSLTSHYYFVDTVASLVVIQFRLNFCFQFHFSFAKKLKGSYLLMLLIHKYHRYINVQRSSFFCQGSVDESATVKPCRRTASRAWNRLLTELKLLQSTTTFRCQLKYL